MAIHFTMERMRRAIENHDLWWEGRLNRPLLQITLYDAYESGDAPGAPLLSQANCTDFSYSPEELVEAMDRHLSRFEFLGDAFPFVGLESFGPGVLAAMCGARLDNSPGSVWFFPDEERDIADIHVRYNPENRWTGRIKDIYAAGYKKWKGSVIMGFPDLGGVLDVAATFRGSQNLMTDLIDAPQEVKRLVWEIEKAWREAYEDFRRALAPQGAYSHWSGLVSSKTSYIVQCDACYMIGNRMFEEFVLDTLRNDTLFLENTIYHMDGVGQLNHLDSLLSLEGLNAVEWQFGDGQPGAYSWLHVYKKILAAGKQVMLEGSPSDYLKVVNALHGSPYARHSLSVCDRALAERMLAAR